MGVVTASSAGGFEFGHGELKKLWSKGSQYVSAYQSFAWFYAVNTGQISIRHGMRGPSGVLVTDQAGGLDALAQARRQIRRRQPADGHRRRGRVAVPVGLGGPAGQRPAEQRQPTRHGAYLPFDTGALRVRARRGRRDPGAGGRRAARRARRPQSTARSPGTRRPSTRPRAAAASLACAGRSSSPLADAGAAPGGHRRRVRRRGRPARRWTRSRPRRSARSSARDGVPVTAPKTMTGRLYSGGGPLDVAAALLAHPGRA